MIVISLYSIKGGVGKTAAAVNLSALAAFGGARTLLLDLDPQASSTYYLKVKPKIKTTVRKLLKGKSAIEDHIKATEILRLDILPASFEFSNIEPYLSKVKRADDRIAAMIAPLKQVYDFVFIDSPPGFSQLADAIGRASDLILLPVVPTTLSVRAYDLFKAHLQEFPLRCSTQVWAFYSMVDRRRSLHKSVIDLVKPGSKGFFFTGIPYLSEVEKMGIYRKPLVAVKPGSDAAIAYTALWNEIKSIAPDSNRLL